MHPEPGFEVNAGGCSISLSGRGIGHIANGLHVGYAVEEDITLPLQPAIGHATERIGERQRLCCEVEFQGILARWGRRRGADWVGECRPVGWPAVWAEDGIEAGSCESSGKVRQHTQRRWCSRGDRRLRLGRLGLESAVLRLDLEAGWNSYDGGSNFGGGDSRGRGNLSGHG